MDPVTTTRWLRDDYDVFYDASDMFSYAVDGERWTDRWYVADESVEVGDVFYVVWPEHGQVQARGVVVAADADERVEGLGPAYCTDLGDVEVDGAPAVCVRIEFDSILGPDHEMPFDAVDVTDVESGDAIDEDVVVALARQWEAHVDSLLAAGQSIRLDLPADTQR